MRLSCARNPRVTKKQAQRISFDGRLAGLGPQTSWRLRTVLHTLALQAKAVPVKHHRNHSPKTPQTQTQYSCPWYDAPMPRQRKAWLWAGDGRRIDQGRRLPGRYVRWYDYSPTGRRISRSRCFQCGTDRENRSNAQAWVRKFNASVEGVLSIALGDAVDEFLVGCSALTQKTQWHYSASLAAFRNTVGDGTEAASVNGTHIDRFVSSCASGGHAVSKATISKHCRAIRRFFKWCIQREYIKRSPMAAATSLPKGNIKRERPQVSNKQLVKLIRAIDTEDRRLAVWLAMTTGLDRGKIHRLTPENVNLDERCISLIRPKTGRSVVVPLHAGLVPLISRRLADASAGTPLLEGIQGRTWWRIACDTAGISGLYFRDLRAVASSRLQKIPGVSISDARDLLGHASIQTTAAHYHIPSPHVAQAIDSLPLPGPPSASKSKSKRRGVSSA